MVHRWRLASLAILLVLAGVRGPVPAAAADEHERMRPESRPVERPAMAVGRAPGPGSVRPPNFDGRGISVDGRGQRLDPRYDHGRYYPPAGTMLGSLPGGYRPYFRGNSRYYFNGGVWYAPRGAGFVVVQPPVGLLISVLPPYYSTVWFGGAPFYYADNVYYAWQPDQNGYAVVEPPNDADQSSPAPQSTPQPPAQDASVNVQNDLIVYPKNGQSGDQLSADRYECNNWASGQTGFDPTQAGGGPGSDTDLARNNYDRAMSACLQGRGYQVN